MSATTPQHDVKSTVKTQIPAESVSVSRGENLVKPKKTIPRVQSWPSRVLEDPAANTTVLLRQPMPKYSFQKAKKLPQHKQPRLRDGSVNTADKQESLPEALHNDSPLSFNSETSILRASKSCVTLDSLSVSEHSEDTNSNTLVPENRISNRDRPVSKVGPVQNDAVSFPAAISNYTAPNSNTGLQWPSSIGLLQASSLNKEAADSGEADNLFQSIISTLSGPPAAHICDCSQENDKLRKEIASLKSQLDAQLQVNSELKKLLVASVGCDLQNRVEKLARDKAELSLELGDYTKKVTEDYEHLDKISIQADMWRSKFLASRVMVDELASGKAFYAMQFQDSQHALQQVLNERHELRANLFESCRGLQQVRGAFDPLNSKGAYTLRSTNVIDLAKANQQLVESIKYRLLPNHVTLHTAVNMESEVESQMTQAEAFAEELLSRRVNPEDFRRHVTSSVSAPSPMTVERYHPFTKHGDLTMNCCVHCLGEIHAV